MISTARFIHCDLFCRVLDNYGDIGVCWRLARQLAGEHGWQIRLLVDDLPSLHQLWPSVNPQTARQTVLGITIYRWDKHLPALQPAPVVIEAFACDPPPEYIARMAQMQCAPLWINLEYLSAEAWVADWHGLASIHPQYGLRKIFFFPGFSAHTGGLIREATLLSERTQFLRDPHTQANFLHQLGVPLERANPTCLEVGPSYCWGESGAQSSAYLPKGMPTQGEQAQRILLFSYVNPHIPALLDAWAASGQALQVLVPPTPALPQVRAWLAAHPQTTLQIIEIPWVPQAQFDALLWSCDTLFMRGEDSLVRAQWAGKPLVWHIYQQAEQAHLPKLQAFLDLYCAGLSATAAQAQQALNLAWSDAHSRANFGELWAAWLAQRALLIQHAQAWQQKQANLPDLAGLLVKTVHQALEKA